MDKGIIFRAKSISTKQWVYGTPVPIEVNTYKTSRIAMFKKVSLDELDGIDFEFEEIIPETIGQFIGITDKNGAMIFEGDIVLSQEYATHEFSKKKKVKRFEGVVYYYVGSGTGFCNKETGEWNERRDYSAEWRVRIDDKERSSKYRYGVWGDFYDCEVVGNIHD